jgi:hypothetical protein
MICSMKKSPLETKAAADARQARAERLRCEQLEERLARLARAKAERQAARTCKVCLWGGVAGGSGV